MTIEQQQFQGIDFVAIITRFAKVPENRALVRDMVGAAAGESVKAIIQNVDGTEIGMFE